MRLIYIFLCGFSYCFCLGAIDEIVNQIKGGRFHLKSTEQKERKPREEPAALKELLNILGTLKRRPKSQQKEKEAM